MSWHQDEIGALAGAIPNDGPSARVDGNGTADEITVYDVVLTEQEIGASGTTRRRRTLLSGPEALTPSEHHIARLERIRTNGR